MKAFNEALRKITTLLLAGFLWAHALLFLNIQSNAIEGLKHSLRLTSSEVILFALLTLFSFLAASGLWGMIKSFAYIYFFPFILIAYALYLSFIVIKAINRWFKAEAAKYSGEVSPNNPLLIEATSPQQDPSKEQKEPKTTESFWKFLSRPFRRFLVLWCILLLLTTHKTVVWACLFVIGAQLGVKIFQILKRVFFFDLWLKKFWDNLTNTVNTGLIALSAVSAESDRTKELDQLWNQVKMWKAVCNFLGNRSLVSNWGKILGVLAFGSIYVYFSTLFSFVYYGMARLGGVAFTWTDSLVTSIFIPFYVSDLPRILPIKIVGGLHCALLFLVGIGTIMNFLRRRLEAIRASASDLSSRFAEQEIRQKYALLEAKCSVPVVAPSTPNANK